MSAWLVEVLHLCIGSRQRCLALIGVLVVRLAVAVDEFALIEEYVAIATKEIHSATQV